MSREPHPRQPERPAGNVPDDFSSADAAFGAVTCRNCGMFWLVEYAPRNCTECGAFVTDTPGEGSKTTRLFEEHGIGPVITCPHCGMRYVDVPGRTDCLRCGRSWPRTSGPSSRNARRRW